MIEQRKAERIKILGIDMDSMRVDRAVNLTSHYLERNKFEYIAFVNTKAALAGHDQEVFSAFMEDAVLVLPGDNNIEDAVGIRHWIDEETSYQAEYFRRLLNRLNRQRASVYLMMEREEERDMLLRILTKKYEKIHVESVLWQDDETIDSKVNEINIQAPDILLISGDFERICSFLNEHSCKINAGLCICMEAVSTDEETPLPEFVERFHLQKLYYLLYEKPMRFWHDILFRRTMKKTIMDEADTTKNSVQDDEKK